MLGGPVVPDLAKIPRDRWAEALIPCEPDDRYAATRNFALGPKGILAARALVETLPPPPSAAARAAVAGVPYARVGPVRPRTRQLNVRLSTRAYEDLAVAAHLLGGTPTQIARMLINAGVRRTLAEYDHAIDEARRGRAAAAPGQP
jgi:hypothetical protein